MVKPDDLSDMLLLDWELSGIMGNPAVDLVSWTTNLPENYSEQHEEDLVK